MIDVVRRALTQLGVLAANPMAFLVVITYGAAWLVFSPETFEWHGTATLADDAFDPARRAPRHSIHSGQT